MGHCKRRGYCCQDVRLAESPEVLRQAFNYWKKTPKIDPKFSDIYLIYPMLIFKYEAPDEDLPYHYRCKHFTHDDSGVPFCSIHDIRPRMCSGFPYYDEAEHLDRSGPVSPYEGCGYNDPD